MYLAQIRKIEAGHSIALIESASFPHMKKYDQRKVRRKYERILEPDVKPSPKKAESTWKALRARYRSIVAKKKEKI
jgi:hypothetical protein